MLKLNSMPRIDTRQFGELDYDESALLQFPRGLPAFEQEREFVLVERSATRPIVFLQSVRTPELCFLAVPVQAVDPQYELAMTPEDAALLGFSQLPDLATGIVCLAILSALENGPITANLLAPVVIDPVSRRAVQAVRADSRYSHQHMLGAPQEAQC